MFPIGSRVVKNPAGWQPSDFDRWGAGEGVGVVVECDFPLDGDTVDVQWPNGRATQCVAELLPAESEAEYLGRLEASKP